MRHFFKNIITFIFFAFMVYILGLIAYKLILPASLAKNFKYIEGSEGHLFTRLREADTTRNIDILFLGSSHTYRGYDVRNFQRAGYRAFNLGSSSQTPIQTERLLSKYLDQFNPNFVVLDLYPILFGSDGIESTLDLVANEPFNWNTFMLGVKTKNVKVYNALLYDTIHDAVGIEGEEKLVKSSGDTYVPGGYVQSAIYKKNGPEDLRKKTYSMLPEQTIAVKNMIAMLKARDIPFVLLQSPLRVDKYNAATNNKMMDSIFTSYGPYINYNEIAQLPDTMFLDPSHLNQHGVNEFNKYVIELVDKILSQKLSIKRTK